MLKLHDMSKVFLQEVRHVCDLKNNLISISKIDGEGYNVLFCQYRLKICIGITIMNNNMRVGTLCILSNFSDYDVALEPVKNELYTL